MPDRSSWSKKIYLISGVHGSDGLDFLPPDGFPVCLSEEAVSIDLIASLYVSLMKSNISGSGLA